MLTARASSGVAFGTDVAEKDALQGDRASRGEFNPEGLEVAETTKPKASRGEIEPEGLEVAETSGPRAERDEVIEVTGAHSTASPGMVGFDKRAKLRMRRGHRR